MSTISFLIPVYRNRGTIRETYEQIVRLMTAEFPELDYEFVLVDDGSDDGSFDEIRSIRDADSRVKAISFSRNFGQLAAIVAASRAATGQAQVILSADLQDPVSLIADMIRTWQAGDKIVIAYRISREDDFIPRITSRIFYSLVRLSDPLIPPGGFDYVLMDAEPAHIFSGFHDRNRFLQGDITSLGYPIKFLPYKRLRRPVGKSQWTIGKKLKYFIDGILNTSYLPIRFMSGVGVCTSLLGFCYAVVVVVARLTGWIEEIGWAPLMIMVLVLGGLVMIMLGIIGEYVWRTYDEVRGRPMYIIRQEPWRPDEQRGRPNGVQHEIRAA